MPATMSWSAMFPNNGRALRAAITRAMREVYDENVGRFAPDDLGDNNTTFGVNVCHNLRHVLQRDTAEFEEVEADYPRGSFVLRIEGVTVHFYKASPGTLDLRTMKFDESKLKLDIRTQNTAQLSLLDEHSSSATVSRLVVVHFGSPEQGFLYAEAGAPFTTATGACDWLWHERFDIGDDLLDSPQSSEPKGDAPSDHGFGLELRDEPEDDTGDDAADKTDSQ